MLVANPLTRLAAIAALWAPCLCAAADSIPANDARRDVDLVIALDVSGSMEGLIESAKQRLWDITNELARARPVPALRVAILSYGKPAYGEQSGYVRVDLPFTADLDAVNATLFAYRTDGGEEYVARAIQTSGSCGVFLRWRTFHWRYGAKDRCAVSQSSTPRPPAPIR